AAVAFYLRLPVAHAAALRCAVVGYLVGFHLVAGHLNVAGDSRAAQMLEVTLSAQSGSILVLLVLLMAAVAEVLARTGRHGHAMFYVGGSACVALVSLALVSSRGFEQPATAALVTATHGLGSLGLNFRYRRPTIGYAGLALLVISSLWSLWSRDHAITALWPTVLAAESALLVFVAILAPAALLPRTWRDISLIVLAMASILGAGHM